MTMRQLTTMEKLSFGGGDVANCVTFGVTSAYLSYYYTDTVGISVAAVGLILGAENSILSPVKSIPLPPHHKE